MKFPKILILTLGLLAATSALADSTQDQSSEDSSLDSGPMRLNFIYSDQFGFVLDAKWVNYITANNAFGFELGYGGQEFHLGGTLAHEFTPTQRIKITAEHLAQDFTADFLAGVNHQWAGQNAIGAAYENLLANPVIKSWEVGGYTANAESVYIGNQTFIASNGTQLTDMEALTGATSHGADAGVTVQPWYHSRLGLTLNYDRVRYPMTFQSPPNSTQVGGTVDFEQVITDHFKMDAMGSDRAAFRQAQAGVSWLASTRPGTRLEIGALASYLQGQIFTGHDTRGTLYIAYSWGGNPCAPAANYSSELDDTLAAWSGKPAVAMPAVLVTKDQFIGPV